MSTTKIIPSELNIDAVEQRIYAFNAHIAILRKAAREEVKEHIARLLLDTPELDEIVVRGYTPSFNDGDVCLHSQEEAFLNGRNGTEDTDGCYLDDCRDYPSDDFNRVTRIIAALEDTLHDAFATNWELTFRRQPDGTVTMTKEYYYCGY